MTQRFHLGDILSITTGYLVAPGHIGGVHKLLDFLTGDQLLTHQLPAACEAMAPVLITQFPELALIEAPAKFDDKEHVERWLAEQVAAHGEWHEVTAPPASVWGEHDALQEAIDLFGRDRVIVVQLPEGGEDGQ